MKRPATARLLACLLAGFATGAALPVAAVTLQPSRAAEPEAEPRQVPGPALAAPSALPLRARLTDEAIDQAVRDTLAEQTGPARTAGRALGAEPYREFTRRMDEAKVPGCFGPDALRHQPPRLGPIYIGGIFALPFWAAAVVRGKCR